MNRQDGPLLIGGVNENTNVAKPLKITDAGELLVSGGSGGGTVDQGAAGVDPWLVTGSLTVDTTGLATSAKQDTGNTSLSSLDTKTPALGQALATGSTPVVLTALQLTTLTPPAALTGFATSAKQDTGNTSLASIDGKLTNPLPISGAVTNTNLDVALSTRLKAADTLAGVTTVGAVTSLTNALPAGTNAIGKLAANSGVDIGDVDVTSVSGNVTVVQGTATSLKTQAENYQGGTAVGAANPLQVSLANTALPTYVPSSSIGATGSFAALFDSATTGDLGGRNVVALDITLNDDSTNKVTLYAAGIGGQSTVVPLYRQFQSSAVDGRVYQNYGTSQAFEVGTYLALVPPGTVSLTAQCTAYNSGSINVTVGARYGTPQNAQLLAGAGVSATSFLSAQSTGGIIEAHTSTPYSGAVGLIVREAQRGQGTMATSIPVTLASNQGLLLAQEDDSADQVGPMVQGVVNAVSPSYLDSVVAPLSLSLDGRLRTLSSTEESPSAWDIRDDTGWNQSASAMNFATVNQFTVDNAWES